MYENKIKTSYEIILNYAINLVDTRGVTVHKSHGTVHTSVWGSRFGTFFGTVGEKWQKLTNVLEHLFFIYIFYIPMASVIFLALSVLLLRVWLNAPGISCCTVDVFFLAPVTETSGWCRLMCVSMLDVLPATYPTSTEHRRQTVLVRCNGLKSDPVNWRLTIVVYNGSETRKNDV